MNLSNRNARFLKIVKDYYIILGNYFKDYCNTYFLYANGCSQLDYVNDFVVKCLLRSIVIPHVKFNNILNN